MRNQEDSSRFSFQNATKLFCDTKCCLLAKKQRKMMKKIAHSIGRNSIFVRLHWLTSAFNCGNGLLFSIQLTATIFLKWNWWCFYLLPLPLFLTHFDSSQRQHNLCHLIRLPCNSGEMCVHSAVKHPKKQQHFSTTLNRIPSKYSPPCLAFVYLCKKITWHLLWANMSSVCVLCHLTVASKWI